VINFIHQSPYPQERSLQYHWVGGMGGSQTCSGALEKKSISCSAGNGTRFPSRTAYILSLYRLSYLNPNGRSILGTNMCLISLCGFVRSVFFVPASTSYLATCPRDVWEQLPAALLLWELASSGGTPLAKCHGNLFSGPSILTCG
jgi:hypothetical protein